MTVIKNSRKGGKMQLQELIKQENIVFDVSGESKEEVIRSLSKELLKIGSIDDVEAFVAAVLEREKHSTTGFGGGIAIPHGKSPTVREASVMVGRTLHDIEWDAMDGKPVNTVFLLAISEENAQDHLQVLAKLAGTLMDDDFMAKLHEAKNKDDILELIRE